MQKNFLETCLSTDKIPDFLKCFSPKTDVFWDQAVYSFQIELIRLKISAAADTHLKCEQN